MPPSLSQGYRVVVVGAGPAGLVTAISLARHGVDTLLVERRSGSPARPRATVLSLRTMELLRSWGIEKAVLAGGDDVDMAMLETPTLRRAAEGNRIDVGYPSRAQSQVLSPTAAACVPQDHLEIVLLEHLSSLPAARVLLNTEVDNVDARPSGPLVHLHDRARAERWTVTADYVVAADGAHSRIRSQLGVRMIGEDHLFGGVTTEFRAPLWEVLGEHRYLLYVTTTPAASGVLLPAGRGDRWLVGFQRDDSDHRTPLPDEVARQVRLAAGVPDLPVRIDRIGEWASGAQLADTFRVGNVLLAGDAAHRITPRGGTGLNTAIADGRDLGWKLLWVVSGWAPDALLATYEGERRVAAAHNVARSADPTGSRRGADTEVPIDLGGRIPHLWNEAASTSRRSTLDLLGDGFTVFTSRETTPWHHAVTAASQGQLAPPVTLAQLDPATARALGIGRSGALLVRPDGVPVSSWWTASDPQRQLREAMSTYLQGQATIDIAASGNAA